MYKILVISCLKISIENIYRVILGLLLPSVGQ